MKLSDLTHLPPTLADVEAARRGTPIAKGPTRRDEKVTKHGVERKADTVARTKAWAHCRGRCEDCRKRVTRGGGLIDGAHFHHVLYRSRGGRRQPNYRVVCGKCHGKIHGVIR